MASELTADMAAVAEKQKAYQEGLKQFVAAQGRKATPLFRALSLQAPRQSERAGALEFAPVTLARFMSDPASARALLYGLRTPQTLSQSQIGLRLKAASIVEMHEEMQARQP
jgi:hypothetical protein